MAQVRLRQVWKPFPFKSTPAPSGQFCEAATADLDDVNMIDPFHLQTYGNHSQFTVIEIFQSSRMLERILENHLMLHQRIWGQYASVSPL